MNDMLAMTLRSNGFQRRGETWSRQNLVQAGMATLTIRPATDEDRARITPLPSTTRPEHHCLLQVNSEKVEQVRDDDQVLTLMTLFLKG